MLSIPLKLEGRMDDSNTGSAGSGITKWALLEMTNWPTSSKLQSDAIITRVNIQMVENEL